MPQTISWISSEVFNILPNATGILLTPTLEIEAQ